MKFFRFLKNTWSDPRIPSRDRLLIIIFLLLIISPFDFIPDWFPIIGAVDDLVLLATIIDYFINKIDQSLLLSHYPWGMKSFLAIKKSLQLITFFSPNLLNSNIWKYKAPIFK